MNWVKDPIATRVEKLISPSGKLMFLITPNLNDSKYYNLYMSHKNDWIKKRLIKKFTDPDIEKIKSFTEDLIKEIKTME